MNPSLEFLPPAPTLTVEEEKSVEIWRGFELCIALFLWSIRGMSMPLRSADKRVSYQKNTMPILITMTLPAAANPVIL